MSRTPASAHVQLLLGMLCFSSLPIAGRLALGHVPPGAIPLVRTAGGALLFALIAWRRGTLRIERVVDRTSAPSVGHAGRATAFDRRDIPFMLLCALLGNVLNQLLFIHGLARTTATNAVVIGSTIPVFAALVAIALGREPVRARRLLGMAIAFGGVAALAGAEELSTDAEHLTGTVLILINALSYGSYLVIGRPLAARYDPFALLAFMFLAGLVMVTPFGVHAFAHAPPLATNDYLFLAFLVAVPTVAAYALVQSALGRTESSVVGAYMYLQPLFTTIGAALILDETIQLRTIACAFVVLLGVWLAARSR